METIVIDGHEFEACRLPTEKTAIMAIRCSGGVLGCGYINMEVAERLGECLALVSGVKSFEDMLEAKVFKVSTAADAAGITAGLSGRDALLAMARRGK